MLRIRVDFKDILISFFAVPSLFRNIKAFGTILYVVLLVCSGSISVQAVDVSTWDELEVTIAGSGDVEITGDLTATSTINITRGVTINGNGHTIFGTGFAGRCFSVNTTGKVVFNEDDGKALQPLAGG